MLNCLFCTDVRSSVGDRINRECCEAEALIKMQDISNIRIKVVDSTIMRHDDDATSVGMIVNKLWQEPFHPVLLYKPQHGKVAQHPSLPEDCFILAIQQNGRNSYMRSMQAQSCALIPLMEQMLISSR